MSRKLDLVDLTGARRTLRLPQKPLGSGADGAVYLVENDRSLVAKVYHDPQADPRRLDKLRAMLADPPSLPTLRQGGKSYVQIAWPVGWLEDRHKRFAGYVMPAVDLSHATPLENLLSKKTRQVYGIPESYGYRLTAAANLAGVVAELHAHRHHIIDLKPVNVNVYTDTFYMAVLDCDGFSIHGAAGARFPAHQYSDGYICPEALQQQLPPQQLGEEQDRFALAVILFQLLNQGLHPYQGIPAKGVTVPPTNGERIQRELYAYGFAGNKLLKPSPWSVHTYLEDETRRLFERAFTSRHDRPSAREWHAHLQTLADKSAGRVRVCSRNPEHLHFSSGCGWCALERVQVQVPAPRKKRRKKKAARVVPAVQVPRPQAPPRPVPARAPVSVPQSPWVNRLWLAMLIGPFILVFVLIIWSFVSAEYRGRQLVKAVNQQDSARVAELLEKRSSFDVRDERGRSAFAIAVEAGDKKTLGVLLGERGRFPYEQQTDAWFQAVSLGRSEIVDAFLAVGFDVDRTAQTGKSALSHALARGDFGMVKHLLDAKASPGAAFDDNMLDLYWSTLHRRIAPSESDAAKAMEAVYLAQYRSQAYRVFDWSPLMIAAARGEVRDVRYLLDTGADPSYIAKDGKTALMVAREEMQHEAAGHIAMKIGRAMLVSIPRNALEDVDHRFLKESNQEHLELLQAGRFDEWEKAVARDTARKEHVLAKIEVKRHGGTTPEAVTHYVRAAEGGYAPAQFDLGWMYESGDGVTKDTRRAADWYRKAWEQKYAKAGNNLGVLTYQQQDWMYNPRLAAAIIQLAAGRDPVAKFNSGVIHEFGLEGLAFHQMSTLFYRDAAMQGFAPAAFRLAEWAIRRNDEERARYWYELVLELEATAAEDKKAARAHIAGLAKRLKSAASPQAPYDPRFAWQANGRYQLLGRSGKPVPDPTAGYQAAPWACVTDARTALTWAVKDDAGALHDKDHRFLARPDGTSCSHEACDIAGYVERTRQQKLCGADDWRLPTGPELESLAEWLVAGTFPYWPGSRFWVRSDDGSEYVRVRASGLLGQKLARPAPGELWRERDGKQAQVLLVRGSPQQLQPTTRGFEKLGSQPAGAD